MKPIKNLLLLLTINLVVLSACKKEETKTDDNNNNTTKTCLVKTVTDSSSFDLRFFYTNDLKSRLEQYFYNTPNGWALDASFDFEYNTAKQLTSFTTRTSSFDKQTMELFYTNNKVSSFDTYDSSEIGQREYTFTVNYSYNANGKISKWTAVDKSDPSTPFAEVVMSYDANGGIKEIILFEPNNMGVMTPGLKYVLENDNQKLIDPYLQTLFMEAEIFYLIFNQDGMKQPNKITAYLFNEADETWELDVETVIQNTYDADNRLTKMVIYGEPYAINWDCK